MDMNPTQTQSKTKTKVTTGLIIAGVILLAAGVGMVFVFKAYTPQGTIPILKYDSSTGEISNPVVDGAKDVLSGPGRDSSLDNLNNNTNNSNTNGNANGNTNGNTNTTNTNTGSDDVTKNQQ